MQQCLKINGNDKAMELYQRALAGREKSLGPDHPDTLTTVNNSEGVFFIQRKNDDAKELYQRVLAGYEKSLGPGHPYTFTTVNNLALVWTVKGNMTRRWNCINVH